MIETISAASAITLALGYFRLFYKPQKQIKAYIKGF
jgi:hypothetical protein